MIQGVTQMQSKMEPDLTDLRDSVLLTRLRSESNWLIRLAGNLFLLRSKNENATLFFVTGLSEGRATNWSLVKVSFNLLFTQKYKF
jgi:hypothetical protein